MQLEQMLAEKRAEHGDTCAEFHRLEKKILEDLKGKREDMEEMFREEIEDIRAQAARDRKDIEQDKMTHLHEY